MLRHTRALCGSVKLSKAVRGALKTMQLDGRATARDAKLKFRELALECHPDRNEGDDAKMKELNKAYAVVKRHLEDVAMANLTAAQDEPRKFEDREAKKEEVSLVQKLAKWMRMDTPQEDPTREYKDFLKSTAADRARVLGTDADEQKFADEFYKDYNARVEARRQAQRTRDDPWNEYSEYNVNKRINQISMDDPMLYWALPRPEPEVPASVPAGVKKARKRRNGMVVRKEKEAVEEFYNNGARRLIGAEKRAMLEEKQRRHKEYLKALQSPAALDSQRMLERIVDSTHEESLHQLRLPGRSADFVDNLGMRPPGKLRRSGQLISVRTKDSMGRPADVVMSKKQFLLKSVTA